MSEQPNEQPAFEVGDVVWWADTTGYPYLKEAKIAGSPRRDQTIYVFQRQWWDSTAAWSLSRSIAKIPELFRRRGQACECIAKSRDAAAENKMREVNRLREEARQWRTKGAAS